MLSDSCFDFIESLKKGSNPVSSTEEFRDGVLSYSAPHYDYPKNVLDYLAGLSEKYLKEPETQNLIRLVLAAKIAQKYFDRTPAGDLIVEDGELVIKNESGEHGEFQV